MRLSSRSSSSRTQTFQFPAFGVYPSHDHTVDIPRFRQWRSSRFSPKTRFVPVPSGGPHVFLPDTGLAAPSAASRDELGQGGFRIFPVRKKVRKSPEVRVRGCTGTRTHASAAHRGRLEVVHFEHDNCWWGRQWNPAITAGGCSTRMCPGWARSHGGPRGRLGRTWSRPGTWSWPCDSAQEGVLLDAELGAVWVRLHGLAHCVRDGFWRFWWSTSL